MSAITSTETKFERKFSQDLASYLPEAVIRVEHN
jgi:hypothetical protein